MKIEINIEKRHFVFLVVLVAVLFAIGVNAYTNTITHVGHDANETGPGIFGGTFTDLFTFPGNLRINNTLNMSGNITFEHKAQITAPTSLLLSTSNVAAQGNLTVYDKIYGQFDCREEVAWAGAGGGAVANCYSTEWLLTGWGECENGHGNVCPQYMVMGAMTVDHRLGNGWEVDCYGLDYNFGDTCSRAVAVCCKKA